jgi:NADH dehydrogenase
LRRDIIDSPLPAPLFYEGLLPFDAGSMPMSPVHVADVAQAFVKALERPETIGQVLTLGGPDELSWKEILTTIGEAVGKRKLMLPAPAWAVSIAAGLLDRLPSFPITRDQIRMLMEGNTCSADELRRLDVTPHRFDADGLSYLNS